MFLESQNTLESISTHSDMESKRVSELFYMDVEGQSHTQNGGVLQKKKHTQISVISGG